MSMILALNGADMGDFADFGAASKSQPIADLQSALKALGNGIKDGVLMKIAVDGIIGPKTIEATNRALTKHLGPGQAPANLRTGLLSQQLIVSQAGSITDLIKAEIARRGFSAPVSKKISTTTVKKAAAKTPDYSKITASLSPANIPASSPLAPSNYVAPAAAAAASPVYRVPAAAPSSGGMDSIIKWSAIGVGVVALAGVAYYFATRKRTPAMAGFAGEGERGGPFSQGLHARIAEALGWPLRDVQSMSLASLRDLVRPVSRKLADEISSVIAKGGHLFGAGFAGLPHAQIEALEALVDKAGGIDDVVGLLSHIAFEKAAHIRENWQDAKTARPWERAGKKLDNCALQVGNIFAKGK